MKKFLSFLWEIFKIVVIALVIVVPIRYFLFQPFFVKGASMEPNFENGEYLIIDELSYRFREPQRGEVIVFKYPHDPSQRYIKRIIGLPGETIEIKDGQVLISGESFRRVKLFTCRNLTLGLIKITLAENEYFVLGDNRLLLLIQEAGGHYRERILLAESFYGLGHSLPWQNSKHQLIK